MGHEMDFVKLVQDEKLFVDLQYLKAGAECAVGACLIRCGAADRLRAASRSLPEGIALCVLDAWRPFKMQAGLYARRRAELSARGLDPDAFLLPPYRIFGSEPVHTTGGAVDVSLCAADGTLLDMGTPFGEPGPAACTFAEGLSREAIERRNILRNVMARAGFAAYEPEWWHFDFGDRLWAVKTGNAVKYRGIFTEDGIVYGD